MRATVFHEGRHLEESELAPALACCPICLDTGRRRPLHVLQEAPRVELLACGVCRGASASQMPRPEVLDRYYRDYYEGKAARVTCPDVRGFAGAVARWFAFGRAPPRARVLDFGGGDGSLGIALAERLLGQGAREAELIVVDYEAPAASPSPAIRVRSSRDLDGVDGRFDVVLASAVLEHVPALRDVAVRLFSAVAPGGYFYARTPYLVPFAPLVRSLDLTFPAHVHDLGGEFWNRVTTTFALPAVLVRSGPSPIEADPRTHPGRALAAALLKLPGRLEARLRGPQGKDPWWRWVGGWEAVLRF